MLMLQRDLILEYLINEDKENANKYESYTKLRGFVADSYIKKWALENIYSKEVADAHIEGFFHIHNLNDAVVPYCVGHDATKILVKGLITPTIVAAPPKHLSSFFDQLVNLIATSQQSWAGAQAVANLNTLAAPFVKKYADELKKLELNDKIVKKLTFKYIKQCCQSFVYNLNFPSRAGGQTPFSNITFNFACPKNMKDEPVLNVGCDGTWGDYEEEAFMIIEAFDEIFREGDAKNRPFTFPIVTINLIPETPFNHPLWEKLMETEIKFGTYSFFNYIGSGIDPDTILSMCCRISIDLSQLAPTGGRWAYAGETGSIGVVTLNMPRLGYIANGDTERFYKELSNILKLAREALLTKTEFINKYKERFMPLDNTYGTKLERFFRTIGVVGLNEMCMNMFDFPLSEHTDFVYEVLDYIREWTRKTQKETGVLWNLEMTPAEGCATRFAYIDYDMFGDNTFIQGNGQGKYYTSMVTPPNQELSVLERIKIEEDILTQFTGGTVHRIYIGEHKPSPKVVGKLIENIAKNTKIPYFDIASTFSTCNDCGQYERGDLTVCPICGGDMDIWDRIVGYYRPRRQCNKGKLAEIVDRQWQTIEITVS